MRRVMKHRSEEHTSELQSPQNLVCRLLLENKQNRPWIRIASRRKRVVGGLPARSCSTDKVGYEKKKEAERRQAQISILCFLMLRGPPRSPPFPCAPPFR